MATSIGDFIRVSTVGFLIENEFRGHGFSLFWCCRSDLPDVIPSPLN
jgi:hypothetical protein